MKTVTVLSLCAIAALSGCHRDSGTSAQPASGPRTLKKPVAVKKGPTSAELTAGMVEAAAEGKSQLPVDLKFDIKERPTVGQPLDVSIAVMPQIDADAGNVQVSGGTGLTVDPGASQIALAGVQAGQVYRQEVKVTPAQDGVLLLALTISLKHDEMTDSREFSIPLIVQR